jgi:hypothetical protein
VEDAAVQVVAPLVTKADGAERDRGEPLERGLRVDARRETLREREVAPDRLPKRLHPVIAEREPDLERRNRRDSSSDSSKKAKLSSGSLSSDFA